MKVNTLYEIPRGKNKNIFMENNSADILEETTNGEYKYGFTTDIDTDIVPPGLSEDVIRYISEK